MRKYSWVKNLRGKYVRQFYLLDYFSPNFQIVFGVLNAQEKINTKNEEKYIKR